MTLNDSIFHIVWALFACTMLNHTSGMPDEIEVSGRVPGAFKSGESGSDIFAMVKATMASKTLSQPPLLVWPSSMQDVSKKAVQTANGHGCPSVGCSLDTARRDELRLMLAGFRRDFPHMKRTMAWYQKMVDGLEEDSAKGLPQLTFLKDARASHFDFSQIQLGRGVPPPKPHELQVVFHRGGP